MITLNIASPDKKIFSGECERVEIKTTNGNVTILPNHVPLVTTIKDGYAIVDSDSDNKKYFIKNAMVSVSQNSIVDILVTEIK